MTTEPRGPTKGDLECFICDETVTLTPEPHPRLGHTYSMQPMFDHLNTQHPGWQEDNE